MSSSPLGLDKVIPSLSKSSSQLEKKSHVWLPRRRRKWQSNRRKSSLRANRAFFFFFFLFLQDSSKILMCSPWEKSQNQGRGCKDNFPAQEDLSFPYHVPLKLRRHSTCAFISLIKLPLFYIEQMQTLNSPWLTVAFPRQNSLSSGCFTIEAFVNITQPHFHCTKIVLSSLHPHLLFALSVFL